jgi:HlyD family secretion protein
LAAASASWRRFGTGFLAGVALCLALAGTAAYWFRDRLPSVSQVTQVEGPPLPAPERTAVEALGRLQPAAGIVGVFAPAGDRVEEVLVKQGDSVPAGKELVRLVGHKDREMEANLARLQYEEAAAQKAGLLSAGKTKLELIDAELAQLNDGKGPDLLAQQARIDVLEGQRDLAQGQLDRLRRLTERNVDVAAQDVEKQEGLVRQAEGELKAARQLLDKTKIGYKTSAGALKAKRLAAEAESALAVERVPLLSLDQSRKLAERRLAQSKVVAPVAGTVLSVLVHPGETTAKLPVIQLAPPGMIALAEVYETDVRALRDWLRGGPVSVSISAPALGDAALKGKLTNPEQIARIVGRGTFRSLNPRDDVDRRVIEVHADLDQPSAETAQRFVGLQVNVKFLRPDKK